MSTYELIVSAIAGTNLLITVFILLSNRGKAASAKLDELGRKLAADLAELDSRFDKLTVDQALRIERMDAVITQAPKHEDLGAIYDQVNATRQQVERLSGEVSGQMEQMNSNLRLVLNQMMKTL